MAVRRLVLDAGGVLLAERFRPFLAAVAEEHGQAGQELLALYEAELRSCLWRGEATVEEFWLAVARALEAEDPEATAVELGRRAQGLFEPLGTTSRLAVWAESAELWLLSNHRHEWLRPVLEAEGLISLFDRLIISSEAGAMKPEPAIYAALREGLSADDLVLFVDDKQENLDAAASSGAELLLADPDGQWTAGVDAWLGLEDLRLS